MSHDSNMGVIEAFEKGVLTSTSTMMPCPWVPEFAKYCDEHPDVDNGLHLTLTSEWENYRWGPLAGKYIVPGLADQQGCLWDNVELVVKHATAKEIEAEIRAQIDRAKTMGLPITHLDTHMGTTYARPDFFAAYRKVANEFGLPCMIPRLSPEEVAKLAPALRMVADQIGQELFDAGEVTLDRLDGGYSGSGPLAEQKQYYMDLIRSLRPGITQVIVHPAYDGDELSAICGSHARRERDLRVFTDPEVIQLIRDQNVRLVTWREIGRRQAEFRKLLKSPPPKDQDRPAK